MSSRKFSTSRTRVVGVVVLTLLAVVAIYRQFSAYLPPQSPQKVASRISGLPIRDARVVQFDEQASSTHPDGFVIAKFEFPSEVFESLVKAAEEADYVWLTSADPNFVTVNEAAGGAERVLYRLRGTIETGSFDLVLLVPDRRQMVVRSVNR